MGRMGRVSRVSREGRLGRMPAARSQDALQPLVMSVMRQFLIEELEIITDADAQRRWIVKTRTRETI